MIANPNATTITTPSETEVLISRTVNAPRRLVFAAYTEPQHVQHWLLGPEGWTMPVCEIDLRPGGTWRYVWRKNDGSEMEMIGEYKEVAPPERLVSTEAWGGDWPETLNTLILTEEAGKTTIEQWVRYVSREARDAAMQTGMEDGAVVSYNRLESYLASLG
jgi:uncharacterized protein YndB with AHSA1/START domain